jgi:hypothetical protein
MTTVAAGIGYPRTQKRMFIRSFWIDWRTSATSRR